jgi:para-nitrobenzyl esterase
MPNDTLLFPLIDGYVLPKYPGLIFEEGNELPIPVITGNNVRETPLDVDTTGLKEAIAQNFGSQAPRALEFYGLANGGSGNEDPLYGKVTTQMPDDAKQRCGAVAEAIWRSSRGRTTYEYQFDPAAWGEPFTRHSAEIPFVFGNLVPNGSGRGPFTEADKTTSKIIQQYWVNFATTGDPNGEGLPVWPKSNPKTRPYLEFTLHDGPVAREMLRSEICDLYIRGLKETIPANTAASR